jgi:hypothetical protein
MEPSIMDEIMEFMKTIERKREADKAESMARSEAHKREMMAKLESSQEMTDTNLEEMKATYKERPRRNESRDEHRPVRTGGGNQERTQGLRTELDEKIMETQRQVQVVMASTDTRTGNLQDDMTEVRKNFGEAVGRTRAELGIRAKGLEDKMAEVEARIELGVGGRLGNDSGRAKPPTFDGSTSWAMFRRQFEAVADHNARCPRRPRT